MCIGCTYVHVCEPHVVVECIPVMYMYYQMNNICCIWANFKVECSLCGWVGGWVDGAFQKIFIV